MKEIMFTCEDITEKLALEEKVKKGKLSLIKGQGSFMNRPS